jgi:hypothetical protein
VFGLDLHEQQQLVDDQQLRTVSARVLVDYRKWGGAEHWAFEMERLGSDEHGVWLGSRPGARALRGPREAEFNHHFVMCVPSGQWWTAIFNDDGRRTSIYVDVTTEPVWDGDVVTMIDLDLDVIRLSEDGSVTVEDEDEFDEHQVSLGYTPDVVARARATADALVAALTAEEEPFGSAGWAWLERLKSG